MLRSRLYFHATLLHALKDLLIVQDRRNAEPGWFAEQVKMVAGRGFEPLTFRL